jgi:hypothetical protein
LIFASVFFIALAGAVSAQSNMNCSIYPRLSVPGDMVPLINMYQGNDSHVEYGNESVYAYTVACKSNITTIGPNCSGTYVNIAQLYNYTDSHISIDNYYSRMVCFNHSGPGLSWSVTTSAVPGTPANYECMFAIANYSNSHVYDCDNVNASYNVNIRLTVGDTTPPDASIIIYGPNGTEFTGTQNVFLNLSYYDVSGISMCRFANDPTNLTSAPWENCTTVKAWLLSEGYGNKTVYFQVNDTEGNTATINDSIIYIFAQDYTPPTPPVVYDGLESYDIDWWNDNTTISAHWFNATEDISMIIYRYRLLENGSCYGGDCNFTELGAATEVTVENLSLKEAWVYSFEVQASNPFNISTTVRSNGSTIDLTPPAAPEIDSSTHPTEDLPYASSSAEFNWTASDILSNGNMSGIHGYSYLLDSDPGTAPDDIEEARYWETLASMYNNGYSQPLKINGSAPGDYAYAVSSQIHTNITTGDAINVRVALAELVSDYDDLMNIKVYLVKVAEGADIGSFNMEGSAITEVESVSWDVKYAYDMTLATVYEFNLVANQAVDDSADDIYVVVSGLSSDDDNRNVLAIAGTTSSAYIDAGTKNYLFSEAGFVSQNTTTLDYAIEVQRADSGSEFTTTYDALPDGTYYFHVKAKDNAGNWGDTAHYKIIVSNEGVSIAIASPADGEIITSSQSTSNISVRVTVSGNASVTVYAKHPDNSIYASLPEVFGITHTFENILLHQGTNEVYAIANTSAGAITRSSTVYVILSPSIRAPTGKTLRVTYGGGCTPQGSAHICYTNAGDGYIGLGTEVDGSIPVGSYAQANTSMSSIKIFMSKQFNLAKADEHLADDDFLDLRTPSFGYGDAPQSFIMASELRYPDVYLNGNLKLSPGKYDLYITHSGVTPDGKVNLTVSVR